MTPMFSRRHFVMGGVFAGASAVAYARMPQVVNPILDKDEFEKLVPEKFGKWSVLSESGLVLPPPDALRGRLYDNLVTLVFAANEFPQVMLLLAYNNSQDGVLQVHRPETCYPVGGYSLSDTVVIDLPLGSTEIPAKMFTATAPERTEQVLYFTRLGDEFPISWAQQRLSVVKANVKGQIPDGMLMRVSLIGKDWGYAREVLTEFAASFIAHSPTKMKRLLVGKQT